MTYFRLSLPGTQSDPLAALFVVKPETLIRWHCKGFRLFGDGNRGHRADRACQPTSGG
jgi:hypothetical protein